MKKIKMFAVALVAVLAASVGLVGCDAKDVVAGPSPLAPVVEKAGQVQGEVMERMLPADLLVVEL